jgi:hypothetical protein
VNPDITKWGDVAAIVASPIGNLVLAFFVWKMSGEIRELKKAAWGEGEHAFVTKSELAREVSAAREARGRTDADVEDLQKETRRLEQDKLSVRDYDREKRVAGRR